ncbi:hypothetical protein D9619_008327 [Psilocybe cf. subviscida]|uniref:DUF6534 domain-containing protein n=1 Tax=Psilocybe cf. subviscida TaxID=2480587 RepID=A0A8H5B9N1_9AGAR|nr:hypothetical protein D9619_008327 [Psilocybe cf. subviscida]
MKGGSNISNVACIRFELFTCIMPLGTPPNVVLFTGPMLIGYMFNCMLFGALAVQVYLYTLSFPNDRPIFKYLVFGIFVIETAQTICLTHDMFKWLASGWGDLSQLVLVNWAWLDTPIMCGVVSCIVQLFYAYRVFILSRSKILWCLITVLSIAQLTSAIVAGVQLAIVDNLNELQAATHISTTLWLSGSALCDITITACISYYLSRNNTGMKETQMIINKLVRMTIETGALTATVATIDVALFLALPGRAYHIVPSVVIAKLYSNSLVMMMNARSSIKGRGSHISAGDVSEMHVARRSVVGSNVAGGIRGPVKLFTTTSNQVFDGSDKSTLDI